MKSKVLLIIALLLSTFSLSAYAGSISGSISYSGFTSGEPFVALFTNSTFTDRPPYQSILSSPGPFKFDSLPDGTYYLAAVIFSNSSQTMTLTDPWAIYGTFANPTPISLSGGAAVTGINLVLNDGTAENPNPFYHAGITPTLTLHLSDPARSGSNAAMATDGNSIFLYKQDFKGSATAKFFQIDPRTGATTSTTSLSLQSLPNKASWIDAMTFYKGALWALGGYGDPSGLTVKTGVFQYDISTSTASNEIPATGTGTALTGLTTDETLLYVGIGNSGADTVCGIIKFDPSKVSQIPSLPSIILDDQPVGLCYGNNALWIWMENLRKMDPESGEIMSSFAVPASEQTMYLNGMYWIYDQSDSTIKAYNLEGATSIGQKSSKVPGVYSLSQNYPNPFNPSTTIRYSVPVRSQVTLVVYNMLGQRVAQLVNEVKEAGEYAVTFSARNLASGAYFYKLNAGSMTSTRKMILLQ